MSNNNESSESCEKIGIRTSNIGGQDGQTSNIAALPNQGVCRRRFLQATTGVGVLSLTGTTHASKLKDREESEENSISNGWNFETGGPVLSSPTVVDGSLYIGSHDHSVYALDAGNGEEQWNFQTGWFVDSSPAVAEGTVYIAGTDGQLYALDTDTGEKQWQLELFSGQTGSLRSSPTVVENTVYVVSGEVKAIDTETGEVDWTYSGDVAGSPTITGEALYVSGGRKDGLVSIDTTDGSSRWEAPIEGNDPQSSPTVVEDTVYVGNQQTVYALDTSDGSERWSFKTNGEVRSSPTVNSGTLYVGSDDGHLYALNTSSGTEEWSIDTGGEVVSSPTVVNDSVFVGSLSQDRDIYAINSAEGDVKWTFATRNTVSSSPVVVDGVLYIGSRDTRVYAIETAVSESSNGSRVRLQTLNHISGSVDIGSSDVVNDTPPEIARETLQLSQTVMERNGDPPTLSVEVNQAQNVVVVASARTEDIREEIALQNSVDNPSLADQPWEWEGELNMEQLPGPGTWINLEIIAENENGTSSLTLYDGEFVELGTKLRFAVVEEVIECDVVLGRFSEDGDNSDGPFSESASLRRWKTGLRADANSSFVDNTMGKHGYRFTFHDNDGELFDSLSSRSSYQNSLNDLFDDLADQTDLNGDVWIAAHTGPVLDKESPLYRPVEHPVYGRERDVIYVAEDSSRDTWLHELGHHIGLHDLYEVGNISDALMGANNDDPRDPITVLGRSGRNNHHVLTSDWNDIGGIDWLTPRLTRAENLPENFPVPYLQNLSLGDDVYGVTVGEVELLLEARGNSVWIYRYDPRFIASSELDSDEIVDLDPFSADTVDTLNIGQQTTEKIGLINPTYLEFEALSDDVDPGGVRVEGRRRAQQNMTVACMADTTTLPQSFREVISSNIDVTMPTLDLIAVDTQGRRVGLTNDSEYVNEIPGAQASGRRIRGFEWIAIPNDLDVEFQISGAAIDQFIQDVDNSPIITSEISTEAFRDKMTASVQTSVTEYGADSEIETRNGVSWISGTEIRFDEYEIQPGVEQVVDPQHQFNGNETTSGQDEFPVELVGGGAVAAGLTYAVYRKLTQNNG